MYSEHFRCDIVHSFDMGRWNCWRHLWFRYRIDMLLCGEYLYPVPCLLFPRILSLLLLSNNMNKDDYNVFRFHRLALH